MAFSAEHLPSLDKVAKIALENLAQRVKKRLGANNGDGSIQPDINSELTADQQDAIGRAKRHNGTASPYDA